MTTLPPPLFNPGGHLYAEAALLYVTACLSDGTRTAVRRFPAIVAHLETCLACRTEIEALQADADAYVEAAPAARRAPVWRLPGHPTVPAPAPPPTLWERLTHGWQLTFSPAFWDTFGPNLLVGPARGTSDLEYNDPLATPGADPMALRLRLEPTPDDATYCALSIRIDPLSAETDIFAQDPYMLVVTWSGGRAEVRTDEFGEARVTGIPTASLATLTIQIAPGDTP